MKRFAFSFMALVFILAISCNQSSKQNSQQNSGPGGGMGPGNFDPKEMVERRIDQMKETLDLSKDQQKQMYSIMMEDFENMQKMREQSPSDGGRPEGMREEMQKMREEQNKKIKAILSDEQWQKYEAFQEEMRDRRRQGGPGGPGGFGAPGGQERPGGN